METQKIANAPQFDADILAHRAASAVATYQIGAINFFGAGEGAPLADVKTIKYFKTQYLFKLFAKNKGRMTSDGREYYQSIVKKLKT